MRHGGQRAAGVTTLAIAGILVVGCTAGAPQRVAPSIAVTEQCTSVPADTQRIVVNTADGAQLGAALVGDPTSAEGVVINYGASQTLCDWLDVARRLAD